MANDFKSKYSIENTIAIVIIMAVICMTVIALEPGILPGFSKPTPTAVQPTSSPSDDYQPEIIPLLTDTPGPTQTVTVIPTITRFPTRTPFVLPTFEFDSQPLPDLTVSGISDPVCATDHIGKLKFNLYVRNIGRASTRYFGPFDVGVFIVIGQKKYGLDEWATQFNGVVGSSNMEVFNLDPNEDLKFTMVLDLKGNIKFGIRAVANSGEKPIREADTTNNSLTKYFSFYCY